ncbi:MAG TPA: RNA polymerase sigma factor, partial [Blastocatellia bacterium]|nr:RNA polymerase sigma factor [Blastocatellia bacterium]
MNGMLKPWPKQQSHEELFVEQYGQLFRWSLKLTGNDSALAEDLLHDVYVQFTLARPDLSTVQNPSAYLYTMLRNRFLSHVRRRAASPISNLAAIDYDCAEIGFLDCDPRERMRVAEELDAICDFACTRKEASKTGSVLILRFFQGYYPAEMAAIMVLSRQSVDTWVRMARTETRAFLQDPSTFKLAGLQPQQSAHSGTGAHAGAATGGEVLGYLREKIFLSRQGKCPGGNVLKSLLTAGSSDPLPTRILAHISSCFECLDFASGMLGLPGPAGRHPNDTFGPDSRWKGGSGTGAGLDSALVKPRRKSRQVFEHSPKKLAVSVNGFAIGSQTVGSELSELTLAVNVDERIGFVEVFSEQNILLLQLDVEPPPEGPVEQSATVALSCDRFLTTSISFASAWPELRLVYRDPEYQSEADLGFLLNGQEAVEQETRNLPELKGDVVAASLGPPANQAWISRLRRVLFPSSFWLRPGTITAALAVLLVVALVLVRTPGPAVSAADLLRKVSASERAALSQPGKVVHRTLSLEEENLARPAAIVHRKVDVWHSASPINGTVEARRVYDDHGTLIGEDFTRGDGSQILKGLSEPSAPQNNTAGMPAEPLL